MSALREYIEQHHASELADMAEGTGKSWDEMDDGEVEESWKLFLESSEEAQGYDEVGEGETYEAETELLDSDDDND